jgi:hypothetical protein
MSKRSKRIKAIFNKIVSICQKGYDAYLIYYNYIDDLLRNNEYLLLQDCFIQFFKLDIRKYNSVPILKQESWKVVLSSTNNIFMVRLKDYYDLAGVYQRGQKIFDSSNNELLGKFIELDRVNQVNFHGITYSYPQSYKYYDDTYLYQLSSVDATKSVNAGIPGIAKGIVLEVQIGAFDTDQKVYLSDPTMSLLDKYKAGIKLMINNNPSKNNYLDNNYDEDYFE